MHDCHDVTQHRSWDLYYLIMREFGEFPCDVEGRISNTSWELTPNFGEKGTVWFYQLYWSFINMIMIRSDRIRKQNDQVLFSNWLLKIANFIALQRSKCSLHFFSSPCSRISRASYKQQHSIPDDPQKLRYLNEGTATAEEGAENIETNISFDVVLATDGVAAHGVGAGEKEEIKGAPGEEAAKTGVLHVAPSLDTMAAARTAA